VEGFWPIFFLLVVLKIPVFGALWLVWWASKSPEAEIEPEDSGGGFERRRPLPIRPRGPQHCGGDGVPIRRNPLPSVAHKFRRTGTPSPLVKPPA
jgi:hypothetical protein